MERRHRSAWADTTDPATDLSTVAQQFLADCCVSPATRQVYAASLTDFLRFLRAHLGRAPVLADVTRPAALGYRAALEQQGRAPATVRTRLTVLKRFANWLAEERIARADVLGALPRPSVRPRELSPLSDAEVQRLEEVCGSLAERAILALLLDAGLTAREAAGLRLRDLDINRADATVTVMGRGQRVRIVPLRDAARPLRHYLHHRSKEAATQAVFVDAAGRPLTARAITTLLQRLAHRAGVLDLSQGRLRCTMATRLFRATTSIEAVQAALGLESLDATARYIVRTPEEVLQTHREHSPLGALLGSRLSR